MPMIRISHETAAELSRLQKLLSRRDVLGEKPSKRRAAEFAIQQANNDLRAKINRRKQGKPIAL